MSKNEWEVIRYILHNRKTKVICTFFGWVGWAVKKKNSTSRLKNAEILRHTHKAILNKMQKSGLSLSSSMSFLR